MTPDLHKRLEEAANGIYPISEIYNDLAMEYVDINSGLREAFKDGGEVGIELGYKVAIKVAKGWLEEHLEDDENYYKEEESCWIGRDELLSDFESEMNKLFGREKEYEK